MESDPDPKSTLGFRIREIKQIGPLGVDIFLASIQEFYPRIAPVLDMRSAKTAVEIGLGDDINAMFEALNRDPTQMAKLNAALTTVRLEKRQEEFA